MQAVSLGFFQQINMERLLKLPCFSAVEKCLCVLRQPLENEVREYDRPTVYVFWNFYYGPGHVVMNIV